MTAKHLQKDSRPLIPHDFLTSLWNEHSATLQLIARSHCSNPEDCVQEAFVRLSKQTHLPNDPMAWLVRVTRNEAISKWRSENRRKSHEQKHASERTQWFIANSVANDTPNVTSQAAVSRKQMKQIALAMHFFYDAHNCFPPQAIVNKEGKPLLSWRVLLLP